MPYEIRKSQSGYCVHKPGENAPVSGGCHESRGKAVRHLRALYAAESVATKEGKGYGARAGEVISGNLTRGGDGKFASAGDATPSTGAPTAPGVRRQRLGRSAAARADRKRQTAEAKRQARAAESETKRQARAAATAQRKAEREARREAEKKRKLAENRKTILEQTGISEEAMRGLEKFAAGGEIEFDSELADALTSLGLLVPADGDTYKMGAAGRAILAAAKSGDVRQAKDALANGRESVSRRREARRREVERMERDSEKEVAFKHGSHNQATHANRYGGNRRGGAGALKAHFKKLSKEERERFKEIARERGMGGSHNSPKVVRVNGVDVSIPARYDTALIGPVRMGKPITTRGRKEISVSRDTVDRKGRTSSVSVVITQTTKGGSTYEIRLGRETGQAIGRGFTLPEARRAADIFLTHTTGADYYSSEKSGYKYDRAAIRQGMAQAGGR